MVARSNETRTDLLQKATRQIDLRKLVGVILNGVEVERDTYTYGYGKAIPESTSGLVWLSLDSSDTTTATRVKMAPREVPPAATS